MYRTEIDIDAPKNLVLDFAKDPFIVAGVFGHISILMIKDGTKGDFVIPENLQQPTNEFKVSYVYGVPPNYRIMSGVFIGPEVRGDEVTYRGYSDDSKVYFTLTFIVKAIGLKTRVYILTDFKFESTLLDKIIGRGAFDLAKHIVEGHFIPYMKFFLNRHQIKEVKVGERIVMEDEGEANQIINKFKEIVRTIELGAVEISDQNIKCNFFVIDGDIKKSVCYAGRDVKKDSEAVATLLFLSGKVKIVAKELDLENYLVKTAQSKEQ